MADLSNTSYGIGALQGISAGIRDAGAILNIKRQQDTAAREEELYPLRKEQLRVGINAAESQIKNAETLGEKSAIELQALKEANTLIDFEATLANHPDKVGVGMVRQILQENGAWNNGKPKQGNLARAREISYTPELVKQRALKNLENINTQLSIMDKTVPAYTQLQEKKEQLERLYKMQDEIDKPTWGKGKDGKDTWLWYTKSGKPVPEREGQVPSEVQKEVMKPDKGVTWGPEKTRPDGSKYQEGSNGQIKETFKPHVSTDEKKGVMQKNVEFMMGTLGMNKVEAIRVVKAGASKQEFQLKAYQQSLALDGDKENAKAASIEAGTVYEDIMNGKVTLTKTEAQDVEKPGGAIGDLWRRVWSGSKEKKPGKGIRKPLSTFGR